jgi:glycosyltransferase involved in cell wall biosynthesis
VNIVMVSKALVVGEYQRKLEAMAAYEDVKLVCVVPRGWKSEGGELKLEASHTRGYRLSVQPIRFNGNFHLFHFPSLGRLLRTLKPDVVHVDEEPYNLATFLAVRDARAVGARSIFFTWQNLPRRYPPPFSLMEQRIYRSVDAAIAGTQEAAGVLRAKGYTGRVEVIPQFGVDPERFSPGHSVKGPPWVIGYLGRLVEQKGLLTLLEAVAGLEVDWRLELIGSGPLRTQLESRAHELSVADRLIFHDQVPSGDIPATLRGLHTLVLPSLTRSFWKEQFGRALVEAMSCGIPVIGSDSGEIPRVIGHTGLVTPEGDAEALTDALQRLFADDSLRADLAERGRARVLERYTHERIAEQTVKLYRELLNSRRQ